MESKSIRSSVPRTMTVSSRMTASVTLMAALPVGSFGSKPSQRLGKSSSSHISKSETETTMNEQNAGQYAMKRRLFRARTASAEKSKGRPKKVTIWNRLLALLKAKIGGSKRSRLQIKKINNGNMRSATLGPRLAFSTFTRFIASPRHCICLALLSEHSMEERFELESSYEGTAYQYTSTRRVKVRCFGAQQNVR
jgi:hypothetical protein